MKSEKDYASKSREKLSSHQRSVPYHVVGRHSSSAIEHKSKHYSSPDLSVDRCKQRQHGSYSACAYGKNMSSKLRGSCTFDNPRDLLEKLISEQSLIQEAVRRLQSQTTTTPVSRKFFSFVDDESCGPLSTETAMYPGEDRFSAFC
ncbi:unnamed protein product [Candidula unifasciata]|uniref:Uncharacterized protein n=1 Tax=Candidula unifasciata TaxID=100452 RepID=A0A8S3ZVV7_9EUPU|nr:unnamed protein product [Candidula unifasciata]